MGSSGRSCAACRSEGSSPNPTPAKLILLSTAAKVDFPTIFSTFARLGGPEIGALAESYWKHPTAEGRALYIERCVPFYRQRRDAPSQAFARAITKTEVALHFNGPRNEHGRMDFREALAGIACPVLVMGGEEDPVVPISFSETIARSLPPHLVRFERLAGCGHDIPGDDPARVFGTIREFILAG